MHDALNELLQQPGIWRGAEVQQHTGLQHLSTGFQPLDDNLPGNGWPQGALTELLHEQPGIGEMRVLIPALAQLSHEGRWLTLIAPPYIPYAPALAAAGIELSHVLLVHPRTEHEALWAVEQALRSGTCGAVLAWPRTVDERSLRRLQLAAEEGHTWGILFRDSEAALHPSPAAVRVHLAYGEQGLDLTFLKCRGGYQHRQITINPEPTIPQQSTAAPPTPQPAPAHAPAIPQPPSPAARSQRPRGQRRRATQMDLPLAAGDQPQATPIRALPTRHKGRLTRLRNRFMG